MMALLKKIKEEKDSVGSVVQLVSTPLCYGLGDPVYEKLSCNLAKAMISIPGCVGFEIGSGFSSTKKLGSQIMIFST
ncbi:MAG: chorismate synthase [Bacteroidales bacterium]|nr:chorismate synthase [Bacteroidales bacterium]